MSSVDERIVQMQFDNQAFERGVNTTLGTLGKLNDSLDSLNDFNTNNLSDSIDGISDRFSNLGIIGATVISNLTNKAVDFGLSFANSLSFEQLGAGFDKYTSVTKDISTIMNQLKINVDEAGKYIDELSWYSDTTSYSLSAMTSAFKTFSAQGIAAETSIPVIMGIGNSLSYAGLAAEDASAGFGYWSKAIARGYLSLKDWQSLLGMGAVSSELTQQLIDAGVAMGQLVMGSDGLARTLEGDIVTIETFGQTLSSSKQKWANTDVITAVFGTQYGEYASNLYEFSKQAENTDKDINTLMKDYAASGAEIDEFSMKAFLAAQNARTFSEAVNAVKDAASTAWMNIFTNVFGNAEEATELWGNFSTWLYDTFMAPTLLISRAIAKWNKFGGRNTMIDMFHNLAEAIESVKAPVKEAFTAIFGVFDEYTIGAKLFEFTIKLKEIAASLKLNEEQSEKLKTILQGVFAVLNIGKTILIAVFDFTKKIFKALTPFGTTISDIAVSIAEYVIKLEDAITNGKKFKDGLDDISNKATNFIKNFHPITTVFNFLKDGIKGAVEGLKNFAAILKETIGPTLQNAFGDGSNTGILAFIAAFAAFKSIKWNIFDPFKAFINLRKAITDTFDSLSGTLDSFSRSIQVGALLKAAIAIGILAASMLLLASIDPERLGTGLLGLAGALALVIGTVKILNSTNFKLFQASRINKLTSGVIKLGVGLILLAAACKILAGISWEGLGKGVATIAAFLLIFTGFTKLMQDMKAKGAVSVLVISAALLVLAGALKILSTIEFPKLAQGLLAIVVALGAFAGFMELINLIGASSIKLIAAASAFLIFAAAIAVLSVALLALSLVPTEDLGPMLLGLATAVGIFAAAVLVLQDCAGKAIVISAALLIFSVAIAALSLSLIALSLIPFEKLLLGIGGLVIALLALGGISVLLSSIAGSMALAALGILAMSVAVAAMAAALWLVSALEFTAVAEGLAAIAAALLLFAGLSLIISPLLVPMLGLAAAMLAVAAGVAALALALTLLGGINTGLLSGLSLALVTIVGSMTALIPLLAVAALEMAALAGELVVSAAAIVALDVAMAAMIITAGLMAAGIEIASLAINSAAVNVGTFMERLSEIPGYTDKATENVKTFAKKVKNEIKDIKDEFKKAGKDCGQGFIDGLKSKNSAASTAGYNLGQKALNGIKSSLQIKSPSKAFAKVGMYADEGLAKGIMDYSNIAVDAASNLGKDTLGTLASDMYALPDILSDDVDLNPTITPVLDLTEIQNGSDSLSNLLSGRTLAANVTGSYNSIDASNMMANELSQIKSQLLELSKSQSVDVGSAIREALGNVGVYMDKSKVGNLVSNYQSNVRRAGGY